MAKEIIDAISMKRALMRMTYEIIERNKGTENLVLVGIKTRGLYLAQRIAKNLKYLEGVDVPVGAIDVSQYRDDLPENEKEKMIHSQQLDFDITDKNVISIIKCRLHGALFYYDRFNKSKYNRSYNNCYNNFFCPFQNIFHSLLSPISFSFFPNISAFIL